MKPVSFENNYVSGVISYLLNNVLDRAFEGVEQENKFVKLSGGVNNNLYEIIIEDNGKGINTKLFSNPNEVFKSGKSRRAKDSNSHGEGLYLVKQFVEESGGLITVENNPVGKGAKFTLKLPDYKLDR